MSDWENSPYRCEICGHGLKRDSPGTAGRVTGWVKNGSSTIRASGPVTAWAHWVCIETRPSRPGDQPGLF